MTNILKTEKENKAVLDQVVLGIAHELNNPNTFIRVNITNLKKLYWMIRPILTEYGKQHPDEKLGPFTLPQIEAKFNQALDGILGATVRIIVISDKLKQCTTESLEQSSLVSLRDAVSGMLQAHQFLIEGRTGLRFVYDENDAYKVSGYRLQLEQAVSTLLTNALDALAQRHGEEGEKKSMLELTLSREGDLILFRVSDNGCGMSRDTLAKAFTPYFTTKPQGVGDGLGLPICQSIVQRHGGDIQITSETNKGTDVTIRLPSEE
ncbi:MAG: ATP-binding protein [Planctomycetota bacterium]